MPDRVATQSPAASFVAACSNLNRFVLIQATAMAQLVGFGWQGDPYAPANYLSLLRLYAKSQITGRPLLVNDEYSLPTIYRSTEGNLAFRFWHDLTHVRIGRDFDLDGEIEVAVAQLDVLRAAGFKPGSLEFELLHADTLGQTLCVTATGEFPRDQVCFARLSLESSLSKAIRAELGQES